MKAQIAEAKNFICGWIDDMRGRRDHAGVLDGQSLGDIIGEADSVREICAQSAYDARVADDEGIALLEKALLDGVQSADEPLIQRALRHFRRSREHDRKLAEKLS